VLTTLSTGCCHGRRWGDVVAVSRRQLRTSAATASATHQSKWNWKRSSATSLWRYDVIGHNNAVSHTSSLFYLLLDVIVIVIPW